MENVLNTIKSKVKTTKVLAILGVVLILLGLFFNVGSLKFDLGKDGAEGMAMLSMFGINLTEEVEATPMNCWGGYVMLILGILALAIVFIDFVKAKLPANAVEKFKYWNLLENKKAIWVVAAIIIVILVATWKRPMQAKFVDSMNESMSSLSSMASAFGGSSSEPEKMKIKDLKDAEGIEYSIGAGFVIILLGAAALIAYPIFYKPEEKEVVAEPISNNE